MQWLEDLFGQMQGWVFEQALQPLLFGLGMGNLLEDGYEATGWLLIGVLQLAVMLLCIAPLERWRPVETFTDRRAVRVDVIYSLIHRLGLFRVLMFFTTLPLWNALWSQLHIWGFSGWHIDQLWVGITDRAWVSLLLYLVVFDFVDYWIHRGQHGWRWWWQLHALHHSQQQMTMWTDSRNHLLDDVLRDAMVVTVAHLVGVAPGQFVLIVALTQLSENLHHANARVWFGAWGERLWISPRFHRRHHAVGIGHEPQAPARNARAHGCNFGVLLPWWDMLFGTANFELRYDPTGVRDQVQPNAAGQLRNYGSGFWAQQWLGLLRLCGKA